MGNSNIFHIVLGQNEASLQLNLCFSVEMFVKLVLCSSWVRLSKLFHSLETIALLQVAAGAKALFGDFSPPR